MTVCTVQSEFPHTVNRKYPYWCTLCLHSYCSDGVSRTGAFCTLYCVLERVKVDQVVDVYLATKTLRIQRAGLLETLVRCCRHIIV